MQYAHNARHDALEYKMQHGLMTLGRQTQVSPSRNTRTTAVMLLTA